MAQRAKIQSIRGVQAKATLPSSTPAPPTAKPRTHLSRSERYSQLADELLGAAEVGATSLLALVREGSIKGRDLAVVVGILIDKVAMLEQREEQPAASVAELMRRARDIAAITQEMERRERQAIDVTPSIASPFTGQR